MSMSIRFTSQGGSPLGPAGPGSPLSGGIGGSSSKRGSCQVKIIFCLGIFKCDIWEYSGYEEYCSYSNVTKCWQIVHSFLSNKQPKHQGNVSLSKSFWLGQEGDLALGSSGRRLLGNSITTPKNLDFEYLFFNWSLNHLIKFSKIKVLEPSKRKNVHRVAEKPFSEKKRG